MPTFPLSHLLIFWGSVEMGNNGFSLNPADFAEHVHCPVLLMQGGRDPRVTNAEAENLFAHLPGPKQYAYFPAPNHCEFLSEDRPHWMETVSTFIRSAV
ncbi:MAG TPA: hypothetical protein VHY37_01165 [Tepidisphaeraceae bacterium]|nr:hypothetical protein [Tepidisphaeraceae bacterium]